MMNYTEAHKTVEEAYVTYLATPGDAENKKSFAEFRISHLRIQGLIK